MLTVEYEVIEDDTNRVVDTISKTFEDILEQLAWEREQFGHPFLHIKRIKNIQ
jgi:hypothetical protein